MRYTENEKASRETYWSTCRKSTKYTVKEDETKYMAKLCGRGGMCADVENCRLFTLVFFRFFMFFFPLSLLSAWDSVRQAFWFILVFYCVLFPLQRSNECLLLCIFFPSLTKIFQRIRPSGVKRIKRRKKKIRWNCSVLLSSSAAIRIRIFDEYYLTRAKKKPHMILN